MKIKEIIEHKKEITDDLIIEILKEVCENGDIMIIKSDGIRTSLKYTAVITSPQNKFDAIRFDAETINDAVILVLNEYVKHFG